MSEITVPKGWELTNLGDVTNSIYGYTAKAHHEPVGVPYLRITDIDDNGELKQNRVYVKMTEKELSRFKLEKGDILIARSGSVGRSFLFNLDNDFVFASYLIRFRPNQTKILPKFLMYLLKSNYFFSYIEINKTTSSISNINATNLKKLEFSLPPIKTQQKIVEKLDDVLGQLEEKKKILLNIRNINKKRINSLYEQINGEIITKYFESKEVKNNSIYYAFEDVCILNPPKSELVNFDENMEVSFVPMRAVDDVEGVIKSPEIRYLKEVKKGYTYFRENDVIFAKITPCMENGKSAIGKNLKNNIGFGSTEFHVLRPKNLLLPEWVYYFVRQNKFRKHAEKIMSGSAGQQRVPISFIQSYMIPVPDIKIQKKIIEEIKNAKKSVLQIQDDIYHLANKLKNSNECLNKLNGSILDKAFSGKLVN